MEQEVIEITSNYIVDKDNKIYDCNGNWVGMLWNYRMSKDKFNRFWQKRGDTKDLSKLLKI